jgi:hypothetical protein
MPIAIAPKSATHLEPWRSTIILQRIPARADAKAIAVYPKESLPRLHPNSAINGFKNMPTDAMVPKERALRKKATATTIQPYPGVSENLALAIRLKKFQEIREHQFIT